MKDLHKELLELNTRHFPHSKLHPIPGGGKHHNPKFMFVFINPTIKNISADPEWKGFRAPFIGTKHIWRIFSRAGLFDPKLMAEIESKKNWTVEFAELVYDHVASQDFYFTNIVKWCGENADLPNSEKIKLYLPLLIKEIQLVKPKYIVTFGLIPFTSLTRQKLKLSDYHEKTLKTGKPEWFDVEIGGVKTKVVPCYFPVGRGSPKKAVELLALLKKL